jgi:hypothetical protein
MDWQRIAENQPPVVIELVAQADIEGAQGFLLRRIPMWREDRLEDGLAKLVNPKSLDLNGGPVKCAAHGETIDALVALNGSLPLPRCDERE